MRTGEPNRIPLIFILLVAAMLIMLFAPTFADGDDIRVTQSNDMNNQTAGNVSTGDTRAFSLSGADMDIDDSLATHSILFGLWQGTHLNPFAEAQVLDAQGKHRAAAEMRCSTHGYKKVYGKVNCIESVIYTPPVETPPEEPDDRYEAVYARLMDLEAQRAIDVANTQKATQRANATAQRVERAEDEMLRQLIEDLKQ